MRLLVLLGSCMQSCMGVVSVGACDIHWPLVTIERRKKRAVGTVLIKEMVGMQNTFEKIGNR